MPSFNVTRILEDQSSSDTVEVTPESLLPMLEKNEYYGGEKGKLKRKLKESGVKVSFYVFWEREVF